MFENFPYTDMHQLNLDWIIKIAKDFLDQYTSIQQMISDGETSLENLTTEGLQQLQDKADNLESLLDEWYNTHSEDIANQLTDALASLVNATNIHLATLNTTLNQNISTFNAAANAKAAETIESIPADYTTLANTVREVQNILISGYYYYKYPYFVRGSIYASNGVDMENLDNTRIRTGSYLPENIKYIASTNDYEFLVFAYTKNDVYVGALDTNGNWTTDPLEVVYVDSFIFSGNYKYKIVVRKANLDTLGVREWFTGLSMYLASDPTLTKHGAPADAFETGNCLADVVKNTYKALYKAKGLTAFHIGAISSDGSIIESGTSYYSDEFPCTENNYIDSYAPTVQTELSASYHVLAFYDSTHTFISRIIEPNANRVTGIVPHNAMYFRVSLTYMADYWFYDYKLTLNIDKQIKCYIFGDSISAGYFSITDEDAAAQGYTIAYRPEGLSGVGSVYDTSLLHNYWTYANNKLGFNMVNVAEPSEGYLHKDANNKSGYEVIDETDISDADLVIIALGFNDWHYNLQRGNHQTPDNLEQPTNDFDTTELTTINRAIWYSLGRAIQKAPNATIIVQTPMNGWLYGGDFSTNWGMGYTLSNSGTLKDVGDDIKYWCDYYGLQILDMSNNNSIINRVNIKDVMLDGSHPTDQAHKQLGHTVAQKLNYK